MLFFYENFYLGMHRKSLEAADKLKDYDHITDGEDNDHNDDDHDHIGRRGDNDNGQIIDNDGNSSFGTSRPNTPRSISPHTNTNVNGQISSRLNFCDVKLSSSPPPQQPPSPSSSSSSSSMIEVVGKSSSSSIQCNNKRNKNTITKSKKKQRKENNDQRHHRSQKQQQQQNDQHHRNKWNVNSIGNHHHHQQNVDSQQQQQQQIPTSSQLNFIDLYAKCRAESMSGHTIRSVNESMMISLSSGRNDHQNIHHHFNSITRTNLRNNHHQITDTINNQDNNNTVCNNLGASSLS